MTGFVYAIQCGEFVKIGFTTDPPRRVETIATSSPYETRLLAVMRGTVRDERAQHRRFAAWRVKGEWFRLADDLAKEIEAWPNVSGEFYFSKRQAPRSLKAPDFSNRGPFTGRVLEQLHRLVSTYIAFAGGAPTTISYAAVGDKSYFDRVMAGSIPVNEAMADRLLCWVAENWPDGGNWPSDVPRPTAKEIREIKARAKPRAPP